MLSRRHLRIKVIQALYAFFQSGNDRVDIGERQMLKSVDNIYSLFISQLSFIVELVSFASTRIENAKKKYIPTEAELNPITRFIDNRFIIQLNNNIDFQKKVEGVKPNWHEQEELIRKIHNEFIDSHEYKYFIKSTSDSYKSDKDIIIILIKKFLFENESLQFFYEEKDIHWVDDYYTSFLLILKFIKSYNENWDESKAIPELYKDSSSFEINDDKKLAIDLFRKTIVHSNEYEEMIKEKAKNWDIERIAIMDVILLKTAITELIGFSSIPVNVTLNEYIEISKYFSSPRSKIFINGMLDKIIIELQAENKIKKIGRGLIK